jgi:hypothetical protein
MIMINTTQEIIDLDGKPIPENAEQNLTFGRVMSNAVMQPLRSAQGQPQESDVDALAHYQLALRLRNPEAAQPVMVSIPEAAMILKMVNAMGHKLITAQIKLALDPPEKIEGIERAKSRSVKSA